MKRETKVIIKLIGAITLFSAIQVFGMAVPDSVADSQECRILGETDPSKVFPLSYEPLENKLIVEGQIAFKSEQSEWRVEVNDPRFYLSNRFLAMDKQFDAFPEGHKKSKKTCYEKFFQAFSIAAEKRILELRSEFKANMCHVTQLRRNYDDNRLDQSPPDLFQILKQSVCDELSFEINQLLKIEGK